jgi:hypothetical protein
MIKSNQGEIGIIGYDLPRFPENNLGEISIDHESSNIKMAIDDMRSHGQIRCRSDDGTYQIYEFDVDEKLSFNFENSGWGDVFMDVDDVELGVNENGSEWTEGAKEILNELMFKNPLVPVCKIGSFLGD